MTVALLLPVLTDAESHLEAALATLPRDALAAATVRDVYYGAGELVLVSDAADVATLADGLGTADARPLVKALEAFTAFTADAPGRHALRPVSEAAHPVPASPAFRPGFTTGGG